MTRPSAEDHCVVIISSAITCGYLIALEVKLVAFGPTMTISALRLLLMTIPNE